MTAARATMTAAFATLAACGNSHENAPDAGPRDAAPACTAAWSQNFAETDASATPCAAMAGSVLTLQAPVLRLGAPLTITIDLGTAAAGTYTSASVTTWDANAKLDIVANVCYYQAGADVVPHGTFSLDVTDAVAPHGMLVLDQAVLAQAYSICGDPLTEHLELTF